MLKTLDPNSIAPGQPDEVRRVTVDLGLSSDRWIRALEFKPGDRRVVRAAFFSLQETGQWLGSWTPWYGVTTLPPDVAYLAPAGSHVVAEIHYRSASQPVNDQGTLGLYFAPRPAAQSPTDLVLEARQKETSDPAHVVSGFLPAGLSAVASAKVEALAEEGSRTPLQKFSASVQLPTDINVLAFKPEVQAGVESVEVRARKPDGTVQVLLLVRGVLADWPTPYVLKEPVPLPKNSELSVAIHYKNAGATMAPAVLKLITSTAP